MGYKNPSRDIARHTDDDDRSTISVERGGTIIIINESGMYSLVLRSNKPNAKAFKRWVTFEVLPAIRKQGAYADTEQRLTTCTPEQIHTNLLNLATQLRHKYPHLNITNENVLLENKGNSSDMRYWADVEKLGLPVIRVLNAKPASSIQVEFSFYGWQKFGQEKKAAVFEKMQEVCNGLLSYNKVRQFAFNDMNTQNTEFVLGFTSLDHAKQVATSMQYEVVKILT